MTMDGHALGLVLAFLLVAGSIAMDVAQAADPGEKETPNATACEALEERVTSLEGAIDRIRYAALFDPCLVSVSDDQFSILCSISPPLTDPQFALRCLKSSGIAMEFERAPDGSGDLFILKDAGGWTATHLVDAVNDIRFCVIYGESRDAFRIHTE